MRGDVNAPHFTHYFMDKMAQAMEPESLIPLSVVVDLDPVSVDNDV
jgi:superfamily I DNA and/or RNA helicase